MKKLIAIVFAVSLIAPSPAQADDFSDKTKLQQEAETLYRTSLEQINQQYSKNVLDIKNNYDLNLQKIKNTAGVKETQSISDYNNALLKWKEVDQVKLNNFRPYSWPLDAGKSFTYTINSPFVAGGVLSDTLSYQDDPHAFKNIFNVVNFDSCYANNTWACPQNNIYQLKERVDRRPTWDFEGISKGAVFHKTTVASTIVAFNNSLLISVKDDGSAVPFSEFSSIRNNAKTSYLNMLSAQSEHQALIASVNTEYANQMSNAEKSKNSLIAKAESDRSGTLSSISWVDNANKTLISHFPDKVKSELMKDGYFKPLKPFYYTSKTGRYIVSATMIDNYTVVATAGPEYKRYKYVYTKKEQADHIKSSKNLLKKQTKPYYDTINQAKSMGWKVECKDKTPCKIKYIKN
jgi:hypothetical protein